MKAFVGLLVAAVAVNLVFALPAGSPQDDAEVISGPRRVSTKTDADDFNDFKGVISSGFAGGYPFLQPNPPSFSMNLGFFDAFEDILRRLRFRLYNTDDLPGSSSSDSEEGGLFPFKLDTTKANKTSTVKVVDGHKVEINDTFYGDENSLFKIRVVNVRPLDSGEEPAQGTIHSDGSYKPVTTAPKTKPTKNDENDDEDRREPLAKDENENEIRGNIDEPERTESTTTTTTTTTQLLSNADNLNAALVLDNTLQYNNNIDNSKTTNLYIGNGYSKTEPNKPVDNNNNNNYDLLENEDVDTIEDNTKMENFAEAAVIDEQPNHYSAALSSLENDRLTIENNEETQRNDDNLNESSSAALVAAAAESELNNDDAAIEVAGEVANNAGDVETTEDDAEDDEDTAAGADAAAAQDEFNEAVEAAEEQVAAALINKQREDLYSSDDEDAGIEMNPTFNAEWADLAADLAATNDANNDFTNDIDVYDTVPIDLSNDIAVNDWAAAQANFPLNSDAELIDVIEPSNGGLFAMPQFEKLTIGGNQYRPMTTTHNMK